MIIATITISLFCAAHDFGMFKTPDGHFSELERIVVQPLTLLSENFHFKQWKRLDLDLKGEKN